MLKKTIASIAVGGILFGGAAFAGTAAATTPTTTATTPTTTVSPKSSTTSNSHRGWVRSHRKEIRQAAIAISAKTIGVTSQELLSDLRSGKSVADVASEHNVSTQTVVNALVSAATTKINQVQSSHKITSAQATKITAALPGRVTKAVNRTY